MAITVARVNQGGLPYVVSGNQKKTVTDVTLDDDYTTGGKAITAANLGLSAVQEGYAQVKSSASSDDFANVGLLPQTDGSALLVAHASNGEEAASSADLSGTVVRVTAFGYGG